MTTGRFLNLTGDFILNLIFDLIISCEPAPMPATRKRPAMKNISNHPVTKAVEPLKAEAVKMATMNARAYIQIVTKTIADHGGDFDKAYPRPDTYDRAYKYKMAIRNEARTMVIRTNKENYSLSRPTPYLVAMDAEGCERFVTGEVKQAEASYDAFVCKLVHKVGDCTSAELDGNRTWSSSIMTVIKPDGSVQRWKTKMIVNRSVLGKFFNQFPTRLMK